MGGMTTKFFTARLRGFEKSATDTLTKDAQAEYQKAADDTAEYWSNRIPAGRGGSWNSQMKDIDGVVSMPKAGGFFVRVGWLNNPPMAEDGKVTWFIYHDTGYHFYANDRIAAKVEAAARRV